MHIFKPLSLPSILCIIASIGISTTANSIEITPYIGQTFGPQFISNDGSSESNIASDTSLGLGIAWQESSRGQGQILINYLSRDFTSSIDQQSHSFDTLYAHFSGITHFKQQNYVTTVSLGIGGTYFKSDQSDVLYPSLTAALGTRYEFSKNLAFVTEIRSYMTLTKNDEKLFCDTNNCFARFDDSIWFDTNISVGFAYTF